MDLNLLKPEHISNYFESSVMYDYFGGAGGPAPPTYLEFARNDHVESNDSRRCINAIGNAKRAFHLQVEMLCDAFGWREVKTNKFAKFGSRLDFLSDCGVLSPGILRRLNKTRNLVEHEYLVPSADEVSEYIDIVELFLMATKDLLNRFPNHIDYELMHDEQYDEKLGLPETLQVELTMTKGGLSLSNGATSWTKAPTDSDYFKWLSAIMSHYVL